MKKQTWFRRLGEELLGWHVWYSGSGGATGRGWWAVPAPADAEHADALTLPNRIWAATPADLRTLAQQRYGWDDDCQSCGVLARECGHRQPEHEKTRYLT